MTDEAHTTFTGVDLGMGSGDYWAAQCFCGGGEGALTTDCVGIPLTSNQIDAIHKGQLDFRNGHWVFEREFFSQLEQI